MVCCHFLVCFFVFVLSFLLLFAAIVHFSALSFYLCLFVSPPFPLTLSHFNFLASESCGLSPDIHNCGASWILYSKGRHRDWVQDPEPLKYRKALNIKLCDCMELREVQPKKMRTLQVPVSQLEQAAIPESVCEYQPSFNSSAMPLFFSFKCCVSCDALSGQ